MKKIVSVLLAFVIALSLCACSEEDNSINKNGKNPFENAFVNNEPTKDTTLADSTDNSIKYISDRRVQYEEASKKHIVFFGLKTANQQYVSASGTAKITIVDDSSVTIYSKDIRFTSADFTEWTNQSWDSSRYMCGLYIADSEIEGSASSSGNLTLAVTLDNGVYFSDETMKIFDLPSLTVSVELPTLPSQYIDTRYSSYTSTVEVTKLEYESEMLYDGTATLSFTVILKLISKTGRTNESNAVCVGYKLYDSDGIVVNSGTIYSDPIAIGESARDTFLIFDLDPRDTYILKLENAS